MDVLSRCACGGAPALYAPDVKSETKYAASVVCHHCGVSMQMANHDSDPKRVVAAWNRAHPHRINTMTVNEKGLEAAQVAAREGCGLFIESQHVFCDDPVVGEAADGYGKPLRQPYCSCKGDAERIIEAYLRASSNDAEPVEILLETAWQAILDIPVLSVGTTGSLPRLANCGRYLAEDNVGQWHYINHAGEWQTCPPPSAGTGTSGWDWSVDAVDVLPFSLSDLERNATAQMGEARGALAIALSAIEKAGDDLQASGAYPVGALAALIVPAEQVRTAITNIDRALSSKQRSGE